MKEFIEYLVKNIVTHPEQVVITEINDNGFFIYTISAAQDDLGTIIGREGRNINSIRNVAKSKAIKDNIRIKIVVEDGNERPMQGNDQNMTSDQVGASVEEQISVDELLNEASTEPQA